MISIAIDGPAGAGKSSVARAVSSRLGYIYVDTGALYRTVALSLAGAKVNTANAAEVEKHLKGISIGLKYDDGEQRVMLCGQDVSALIRTPEMSMGASQVSAIPCVRRFLFNTQREIAENNNVVMDGRDIGTVVLPDATVKIYLTAAPEERARRRMAEMLERGESAEFSEVLADIKKRDYNDMHRDIAPLRKADDALLVDTTDSGGFENSVSMLYDIITRRLRQTGEKI